MTNIVAIVEGQGEESALPILLRRLGEWLSPSHYVNVLPALRVKRNRFLNNDDEFRKKVELAALKCGDDGWILILLEADDDCPAELHQSILQRARSVASHRPISVVLPNREFEVWFIAASASLSGCRKFVHRAAGNPEPESIRGAKEWLSQRMENTRYHEVTDQPAFAAVMDLTLAFARSRSFRKLCSDWSKNTSHA